MSLLDLMSAVYNTDQLHVDASFCFSDDLSFFFTLRKNFTFFVKGSQ